jgi:hypothetical protein
LGAKTRISTRIIVNGIFSWLEKLALPRILFSVVACAENNVQDVNLAEGLCYVCMGIPILVQGSSAARTSDSDQIIDVYFQVVIDIRWTPVGIHQRTVVYVVAVKNAWCVAHSVMIGICTVIVTPVVTFDPIVKTV